MTTPIPTPPAVPLLGHATQLDRETPLLSFDLLADQYGEIYQLNLLGECSTSPHYLVITDNEPPYFVLQVETRS